MHDVDAIAEQFTADGFVVVRRFLSEAEVDQLDRRLEHFIEHVVPHVDEKHVQYELGRGGPIKHLSLMELYDDYFKSMLTRPATMGLVSACLGQPAAAMNGEVFYKPARVGSAAPYHQDNAYLHLEPAEGAVVWTALDDVTLDNGAVHFAKGSHQAGDLSHDKTGVALFSKGMSEPPDVRKYPEVSAVLKRGDASMHHILCAHRSGPNHTHQNRRGYITNYKSVRAAHNQARADAHATYIAGLKPAPEAT